MGFANGRADSRVPHRPRHRHRGTIVAASASSSRCPHPPASSTLRPSSLRFVSADWLSPGNTLYAGPRRPPAAGSPWVLHGVLARGRLVLRARRDIICLDTRNSLPQDSGHPHPPFPRGHLLPLSGAISDHRSIDGHEQGNPDPHPRRARQLPRASQPAVTPLASRTSRALATQNADMSGLRRPSSSTPLSFRTTHLKLFSRKARDAWAPELVKRSQPRAHEAPILQYARGFVCLRCGSFVLPRGFAACVFEVAFSIGHGNLAPARLGTNLSSARGQRTSTSTSRSLPDAMSVSAHPRPSVAIEQSMYRIAASAQHKMTDSIPRFRSCTHASRTVSEIAHHAGNPKSPVCQKSRIRACVTSPLSSRKIEGRALDCGGRVDEDSAPRTATMRRRVTRDTAPAGPTLAPEPERGVRRRAHQRPPHPSHSTPFHTIPHAHTQHHPPSRPIAPRSIATMSSQPVAPPTPQEVSRKLSIHSTPKPKVHPYPHPHPHRSISPTDTSRPPQVSPGIVSGNESDSDSMFAPDYGSPAGAGAAGAAAHTPVSAGARSSAIAERRRSGEDSEEDDDDEHDNDHDHDDVLGGGRGGRRAQAERERHQGGTWKKRWFVLRPTHLAYYKTSAEYQLHRLLDLNDVHSCTPVSLKKHENTFGVVSATRTFYLQAQSQEDMQDWVRAIREAKETLQATSTQNSASTAAIPIPVPRRSGSHPPPPVTPSPPHHLHAITSSESEDASPHTQRMYATSSSPQSFPLSSSPRQMSGVSPAAAAARRRGSDRKNGSKPVASGYLMKCGSKRRNWRKRWFVLNGDKLMYSGSHMDTKPHRQIPLSQILDAFEYDLPAHRGAPNVTSPPAVSPPPRMGDEADPSQHTFKIVTTKRTLLLCAPSEEEEIRWLSAVRALIARRTDAGVVPGDEGGRGGAAVGTEGGGHGQGGVGSGSGSGSGLKNRREAPPRKMSTSGGSIYAAPIAEESVS
ncbi:hypothetical protein EVG20_g1291 [Dentipellis fragilis]|uniref:PH domain-containing protein n=1 Tax=Dentipellis fragilis TaxID=205917 RepID=A0A4Y9ZB90_9AGAM|nr:hypothetical protein EVG20_g1291 [Dentipellis fragilis]